jgi:hypothetical protein
MKKLLGLVLFNFLFTSSIALAQEPLLVVFPPTNYQTSTEKIFFIGTAPSQGQVLINGKLINRSKGKIYLKSVTKIKNERLRSSGCPLNLSYPKV